MTTLREVRLAEAPWIQLGHEERSALMRGYRAGVRDSLGPFGDYEVVEARAFEDHVGCGVYVPGAEWEMAERITILVPPKDEKVPLLPLRGAAANPNPVAERDQPEEVEARDAAALFERAFAKEWGSPEDRVWDAPDPRDRRIEELEAALEEIAVYARTPRGIAAELASIALAALHKEAE